MRIGPIIKKISENLTDEERKTLLNELEKSPRKIIEMLTPETKNENEKYANKIIHDIRAAINQFGKYHYYDKGASEVMFVDVYVEDFIDMDMQDVQEVLLKVLSYEHGKPFCQCAVVSLDDKVSNEQWDELMNHPKIADLY